MSFFRTLPRLATSRLPSLATLSSLSTAATRAAAVRLLSTEASAVKSSSSKDPAMFCFQCEQTDTKADGSRGCTVVGVCGKDPEVAALQDALVCAVRGLSAWTVAAEACGLETRDADSEFVFDAMFATMTNVNFDPARIHALLVECYSRMDRVAGEVAAKGGAAPEGFSATWRPRDVTSMSGVVADAAAVSVPKRQALLGESVAGLQELIVYAIKGLAAYGSHARALDKVDPAVNKFVRETLAWLDTAEAREPGNLLGRTLAVGENAVKIMSMLDAGHAERLGDPTPAPVVTTAVEGKAILFSGHDMRDLEALLEQTKGQGVNVYTHGEMLPAHGYPALRAHSHLVGHYGGPWQLQKMEFSAFPGPVVVSTNCIIEPRKKYKDRIYTMNTVGFPGVKHVQDRDFSQVIAQAKEMDGFAQTVEPVQTLTVGFGHKTVLGIAPAILDAVGSGKITRFNVIGGCDGSEGERSAFTDIGRNLAKTEVVLTLGCGKYRINRLPELQDNVPGTEIPRLIDVGQCNDAYSAIVIANGLAGALNCGVNDLPLSFYISHLEQKAAAVLTAMLHLNLQGIQLGPTLPAFITPEVLSILVEKFNIGPVTGPKA